MDAIVASTAINAEACGLEDRIGTIEKGKIADILIIDGNPLEDITLLQNQDRIKMVVKEGIIEVNRNI
jgi:imidazolonepropionase-like amidohydrolase